MSTTEQKVDAVDWLRREMNSNPTKANYAAILLDELDRLSGPHAPPRRPSDTELPHARWHRILIANLIVCTERHDWHGASDAANDLRELEAAYPVLRR